MYGRKISQPNVEFKIYPHKYTNNKYYITRNPQGTVTWKSLDTPYMDTVHCRLNFFFTKNRQCFHGIGANT